MERINRMSPLKKLTIALLLLSTAAIAAAQEGPASTSAEPAQYANYTLMLVEPKVNGTAVVPFITKDQRLRFVRVDRAQEEASNLASLVPFGDVLQLLGNLTTENERLKTENARLWRLVENRPAPAAPAPIIVQATPPPPQPDPNAARRELQMMLMRSLFAPKQPPLVIQHYDCTRYPALCVH